MKELKTKLERALAVCAMTSEELASAASDAEMTTRLLNTIEDARRELRAYAIGLAQQRDEHLRNEELDALAAKLGPKGMQMLIERTQRVEMERTAASGEVKAP